jgi:hypothetical protein
VPLQVATVEQESESFRPEDLRHWKILRDFQQRLARCVKGFGLHPTFADPQRQLFLTDYLSLFLFGLFNPVVRTVRGLCVATDLPRVQQEVCRRHISLGSFSEAQHVVDPVLLEKIFTDLAQDMPALDKRDPRLRAWDWMARDGSIFRALPRMSWALYGAGAAGAPNRAARLHLSLHLLEDKPVRAQVTAGKRCERAVWKEQWLSGDAYVGDRYFAEDYKLLGQLQDKGCAYVLRLLEQAVITVEEELPLSPTDREAGVVRQAWVRLGSTARYRSVRVRVVWIQAAGRALTLVTNLDAAQLPAELVSLLYRKRWQVELFFRWVKCILRCRHWLAESQRGATIQIYLALIAGLLLQMYTGQRPTKRMMELIQFHLMQVISLEELIAGLQREFKKLKTRKKN